MWSSSIGLLLLVLLAGTSTSYRYHGQGRDSTESDSSSSEDSKSSRSIHVHGALHNHYGSSDNQGHESWRFQVGGSGDFGPYDYIDPNTGERKGFLVDLLIAVCAEAGKKCNWMIDAYTNCWTTEEGRELPGVGMMAGYYEACLGYLPTPERMNSLNFSTPFSENLAVGLYYRGGAIRGDPLDLTGRKVGFASGWFTSPTCLGRKDGVFKGTQAGEYTAVMFDTSREMVQALLAGSVDALWGYRAEYDPQSSNIQAVGPDVYCTSGGMSMMTRYSQRGLMDWWNEAFESMQRNGDFRQLCRKSKQLYGSRGELFCAE